MKLSNIQDRMLISGMVIAPSFFFQGNLAILWIQVLLFILAASLSGKKFRLLPNLAMLAGIVFANLFVPNGKVLFYIIRFPITEIALINGLRRSATLIGMIYLSRFSVRKGLMLPGKMGSLLSLVFFYFDKIIEGEKLTKGNLMKKIDEKLLSIQLVAEQALDQSVPLESISDDGNKYYSSYAFLLILIIFNWAILAWSYM